MLHFLFDADELGYLYHNRELHPIGTIPREFLFARFAWSIFPLLGRFLNTEKNLSVSRNVKSVWTVTEQYARWVDANKSEKGSKRKRATGGGDAGGSANTVTPAVVDRMEYVFEDETADMDREHCCTSESENEMADTDEELSDSGEDSVISVRSNCDDRLPGLSRMNERQVDTMAPTDAESAVNFKYSEVGDPNKYTTTTASSSLPHYLVSPADEVALEQCELAEDYRIAREVFPDMLTGAVVNRDIAFYPGHRQIERLKQRLRRDRGWVTVLAECCDSDSGGDAKRKRVDR